MSSSGSEKKLTFKMKDADGRVIKLNIQTPMKKIKEEVQAVVKIEEEEATILCPRCSKSFYNRVALRNHLNHTHGVMPNEEDLAMTLPEPAKPVLPAGGQTTKTDYGELSLQDAQKLVSLASEDVSYIIVKTIGGDPPEQPSGGTKRRRVVRTAVPEQDSGLSPGGARETGPVQPTGPFECLQRSSSVPGTVCHQVFLNCCEYSLHYRRDHTKRRKPGLRCQVCEKQLDGCVAAPDSWDAEEASRTCAACGERCADPTELLAHTRSAHAKPKPFRCLICQKGFTQQGGLIQHMRMHTGDRPFPCTVCGKAFTQKAGLDQHLRIHTKIKPFRCVVCDKSFSQSVHLRQHMRTHTNIQPFQCGTCGRRFKQSSHLNFHVKSHQTDGTVLTDTTVEEEIEEEYVTLGDTGEVETVLEAVETVLGDTDTVLGQ